MPSVMWKWAEWPTPTLGLMGWRGAHRLRKPTAVVCRRRRGQGRAEHAPNIATMVARFEPRRRPVTWERVCLSRLAHQHLLQRRPARALLDVARDLCGLHAQVRSSAELAAAVRLDGLARSAVSRALWTDRTLVKTWAMRGTLHLLPADEYALWVAAQSTRDHFLEPARLRPHGLTPDDVLGVIDAVGTALDGRQLSREELAGEVARLRRDPRLGEMLLGLGWPVEAGSVPWPAVLRPEPGHQGQLRATRPVARRLCRGRTARVDPGASGGAAGDRPALPRRVWPRHPRRARTVVGLLPQTGEGPARLDARPGPAGARPVDSLVDPRSRPPPSGGPKPVPSCDCSRCSTRSR